MLEVELAVEYGAVDQDGPVLINQRVVHECLRARNVRRVTRKAATIQSRGCNAVRVRGEQRQPVEHRLALRRAVRSHPGEYMLLAVQLPRRRIAVSEDQPRR
jgi:hypothetical protein